MRAVIWEVILLQNDLLFIPFRVINVVPKNKGGTTHESYL
uniref:Uncharacterized protein n=2 Tax=unclassified Caudoviricetes TaxID=2788787 RepID=A0A8S5PUP8_9CAUD|nr:MAG TPA: hypothetical protein [Siphoviridae sp. ctPxx43]DAE10265.1 MAG TPA: hypothetical protein [Siphoviridae sp. ct0yh16]